MSATTDYGRDTSCTTSLRTGRFVTGVRLVAEAAFRRVSTKRGLLRGGEAEKDYGIDLSDYVGSTNPKRDAAALPGIIGGELRKDERIEHVDVDVLIVRDGAETNFEITIEAQTGEGPFTLVILASKVTVELLGIKADS